MKRLNSLNLQFAPNATAKLAPTSDVWEGQNCDRFLKPAVVQLRKEIGQIMFAARD